MKVLIFFSTAFFLYSCNDTNTEIPNCKDLAVKERYIVQMGRGYDSVMCVSYAHYCLMLNDYDDKCFDKYDFIYMADKYLDTVTIDTPVASIMFSKSFDFEPNGDLSDDEGFKKNGIVEIWYSEDSVVKKIPEVRSILFWRDGKYYEIKDMPVWLRQSRMNYYHEKQSKSNK